jgi:Protein of unknown function (DUF4054)
MLTTAGFRLRFPEFAGVDEGQVAQFVADAANEMDAGVWGSKLEQGQAYLVAMNLCQTAFGQAARMVAKAGQTSTYEVVFRRLQREVTSGFRNT